MSNRIIKKIAVLGSGVMGSRIACHFAGIGLPVLLLDIAPKELSDAEKAKNLSLDHPAVKNRIVNDALTAAVKSNPSPLYYKDALKKIKTGNFTDSLEKSDDGHTLIFLGANSEREAKKERREGR